MNTKLGRTIIYFTCVYLFYLKSLCLMSALVKIGFYYHKQHLRSDFNFKIYIYFKACVYFFFRHQYFFSLYLFSILTKSNTSKYMVFWISFVRNVPIFRQIIIPHKSILQISSIDFSWKTFTTFSFSCSLRKPFQKNQQTGKDELIYSFN